VAVFLDKLVPSDKANSGATFSGVCQFNQRFNFLTPANTCIIPQAARQFLLQPEGISVILAGMSKADYVRENVAALEKPELSRDEIKSIRALAAQAALLNC
jgi:aryl-alcohol dehydrogenase-like predicted oxidoreductase